MWAFQKSLCLSSTRAHKERWQSVHVPPDCQIPKAWAVLLWGGFNVMKLLFLRRLLRCSTTCTLVSMPSLITLMFTRSVVIIKSCVRWSSHCKLTFLVSYVWISINSTSVCSFLSSWWRVVVPSCCLGRSRPLATPTWLCRGCRYGMGNCMPGRLLGCRWHCWNRWKRSRSGTDPMTSWDSG